MSNTKWIAEARKQLFIRGESLKDLAKAVNLDYGYVRIIMSGNAESQKAKGKILSYLGLSEADRAKE